MWVKTDSPPSHFQVLKDALKILLVTDSKRTEMNGMTNSKLRFFYVLLPGLGLGFRNNEVENSGSYSLNLLIYSR